MLRQISRLQYHIFLFIYVVITVIPLIWVFLSSFKTRREIAAEPWALPSQVNLDNYISAWSTAKVSTYFFNSLYVALGTCFLTMLIAGTAAFALSRMRFQKTSGVVYLFYLLGLVIPVGVLLTQTSQSNFYLIDFEP